MWKPWAVFLFSIGCTADNPDWGDMLPEHPESPPDLSACVSSLSGVGTGDFSIHFQITTKASVESTVLYQRAGCDANRDFWNVNLSAGGQLIAEVVQGGSGTYTVLTTTTPVNDGKPHAISIDRVAFVLAATTDGGFSGSKAAPGSLGQLPPLGITKGNPCEAAGLKPLSGSVTDVCLTRGRVP